MYCKNCGGSSEVECSICEGTGQVLEFYGNPGCGNEEAASEAGKFREIICERCGGEGIIECPICCGGGEG